jgi:WD40-like Beta Propeller Repeat
MGGAAWRVATRSQMSVLPACGRLLAAWLLGAVMLAAAGCAGGPKPALPLPAASPAAGTVSPGTAATFTVGAATASTAGTGGANATESAGPAAAPTVSNVPSGTPPPGPTTVAPPETTPAATASATDVPTPPPPPATPPPPVPLVPDSQGPPAAVGAGTWAQVTTQGGCLKVRISFEDDSLAIDCLPYRLLVFVDGARTISGSNIVHLAGRGYVHPEGLTPVDNPVERKVPFADRPHGIGSVAFTAPDGNVWTIGADGANAQQITGATPGQALGTFYSSMAWSPDGTKLLLRRESDSSHDVQIYEAGQTPRTIYPPEGIVAPVNPGVAAWSADSDHVLVTDYDQAGNACDRATNQYSVRSIDINTGTVIELFHGEGKGFVAGIAASPDGRSAGLLIGAVCDAISFAICLLALQPDAAYAVTAGQLRCPAGVTAGQVAWSPDGRYLAYTSRLQGRGDESALSSGLPLQILEPRAATHYPLAFPLSGDRNIIGVVWLADSRTLRIEEEVPRGLTDTELSNRVLRRITVDGSRFPITEIGVDRLTDLRVLLDPASVRGDYALARGARGELWLIALSQQDARWPLTDVATGATAWAH